MESLERNRILLVFPPSTRFTTASWPSLGIACIAAYCLQKNPALTIKVIDFAVEKFSRERWLQELADFEPEVVGIGTNSLNQRTGLLLAQLTKEFAPRILTIMGGVHPSACPEECLKYADMVVRGEGEETFYEIIQGREEDAVLGISYRRDGEVVHNPPRERIKDLDSLPSPAYHLFPMDKYSYTYEKQAVVIGSRGCPYNCTFCASPAAWGGRRILFKSPEKVIDEVEYLHQKYGFRSANFSDAEINIPMERAHKICDEIMKRGLHQKMDFKAFIRADQSLVSLELFQRMRAANFTLVNMGIESASQKVLKAMRKDVTPDETSRAIRLAREAGIRIVWGGFMVGNWDETLWDVFKTWWFVLRNDVDPFFNICIPFPGTEFNRRLREAGYLKGEPDWSMADSVTAMAATNKMPKIAITAVYFLSIFLQISLTLTRSRERKRGWLQIRAAACHLMDKVRASR